ncbi:MAG: alpha-1,4-glucan--maltose-1-phosphate maltosyltransferase [Sphingobacteriales bacterium]|nr:MAG: alpha-1,4-glucan--maltose-1-phosphate maltosyltransferase [Sphingobacteriales bacterium]
MLAANGRRRVIITNVSPQVEGGQYPAKTTINYNTVFSADIFLDGHDEIGASLLLKHRKERQWKEIPMTLINNDHWEITLQLDKIGHYQFQVQAWVDHFSSWKKGLLKKHEAGQDVKLEMQIGVEMLEQAISYCAAKDKSIISQAAKELRNAPGIEEALQLIGSDKLTTLMYRTREKELITPYPVVYEIEVERKKATYSTWYELFPRSASTTLGQHGTFQDVIKLLPRVAGMGFDTLYFPPIHPIGEQKRKGKNNSLTAGPEDPGSPWAIGSRLGGHKAIHPELGTLKDFEELVAAARSYDIEIAMDIAFQCAPDHPYVKQHPQWFKWRPDGTVQYAENPPKKYEDILPFNFETEDWQNLWKELKSVLDYWIDKGISVFRIDNPHTKAFHFWEWAIAEVRKKNPEVLFLAEAFTRPRVMERLAKAGFNQSYTYFTWRNTKAELEEYMTELTQTDMRHYFRPNFWPNTPDILPAHLVHGGENAHITRLILAATLSSNYGLYGPVYEFCVNTPHPGKEEYTDNEKYELKHWNWDAYTRVKEIITRVNRIRKENTALQDTYNISFAETTNEQVICYCKVDEDTNNILIIAVNLDFYNTQSAHVKLPLKELGILPETGYTARDLLSGDKYQWQGEWNYVQLNPNEMPAHIFRVEL